MKGDLVSRHRQIDRIWSEGVDLSTTEKAVLTFLWLRADSRGICWPSVAAVARATARSVRAVDGAIATLERCGLLRVVRERRPRQYLLTSGGPSPLPADSFAAVAAGSSALRPAVAAGSPRARSGNCCADKRQLLRGQAAISASPLYEPDFKNQFIEPGGVDRFSSRRSEIVDAVHRRYLEIRREHRPKSRAPKLKSAERARAEKLLRDGYTQAELELACEGLFRSPHHLGQNDRSTEYLEFFHALSDKCIDGFIAAAEKAREEPPPRLPRPPTVYGPPAPAPPDLASALKAFASGGIWTNPEGGQ